MRKNILLIIFAVAIFFSFSEITSAKKKEFFCNYEGGGKVASFQLVVDKGGTKAETATITDDSMGEDVVNWSYPIDGTSFSGKDYYNSNGETCPPYAYYFDGSRNHIFGISLDGATKKFVVAPEPAGGSFEASLKKYYTNTFKNMVSMKLVTQQEINSETKLPTSCLDFQKVGNSKATLPEDKYGCENNPYFACIWVETNANPAGGYCNTDNFQYVKCGDAFDIPNQMPRILSFIVNLLKIATPIILVIVSIISLLKALAASKEDEIKKAQSGMIRKIIASVMVFFIISIVQFVILKVADVSEKGGLSACLSCMLNNDCQNSLYYKTNVGGQYFCTGLAGNEIECGENKK